MSASISYSGVGISGLGKSPWLTEKELLHQIASNYTKEQVTTRGKLN